MFIGCSAYPECSHIESLDQPSQSKSKAEEACPECGSGHLVERQSRFGKQFFACDNYPKCKFAVNHPPINGRCEVCRYPLLVIKKAASDDSPAKHQCAARKCQHIQGE
jgi:putative DNA topoisomerase